MDLPLFTDSSTNTYIRCVCKSINWIFSHLYSFPIFPFFFCVRNFQSYCLCDNVGWRKNALLPQCVYAADDRVVHFHCSYEGFLGLLHAGVFVPSFIIKLVRSFVILLLIFGIVADINLLTRLQLTVGRTVDGLIPYEYNLSSAQRRYTLMQDYNWND